MDMTPTRPKPLIRVAIVQHAPLFLNLEASLEKACQLIRQAADQQVDLVAFPETWLPGYPVWLDHAHGAALWDHAPAKALYRLLVENSIEIPGPHLDTLRLTATEVRVDLVMGVHERNGGTLYNTMLLIPADGSDLTVHRKLVPTYSERLIWGRGDGSTLGVMDTAYGRIGGLICWEHWMPLARAAMHAQHETIHIAQWPACRELHQLASRHYAFEGQCFVLAAGSVLTRGQMLEGCRSLGKSANLSLSLLESIPGDDERILLTGGSAVIGPDADLLAGPVYNQATILTAEIDPGRIHEGHLTLDTQGHYSRPDVFRLVVNTRPQPGVDFVA